MRNASGRRESKTRRIRDALLEEKRGSLGYGAGETAHLDSGGAPAPGRPDGEAWKVPGEKETAEEQTPSAMTCPWCGQEMRMGYLVGGRDAVRLVWERPRRVSPGGCQRNPLPPGGRFLLERLQAGLALRGVPQAGP